MADTVIFKASTGAPGTALPHQVFTRLQWDDPWTLQTNLYCDNATWAVAPSVSHAQLSYRYGDGMLPGETAFADIARFANQRHYVKISFDSDRLVWYGILEVEGDRIDGLIRDRAIPLSSGHQTFAAQGLEFLLDQKVVLDSVIAHPLSATASDSVRIGRGLIFNKAGKENMTSGAHFPSQEFAETSDVANFWSTREIVRYLMAHQTPLDDLGEAVIQWTTPDLDLLPDWDKPVLAQHGRRLRDLLNSLMARQRLFSYRVDVDATNKIELRPFTFTDVQIDVDDDDPTAFIAANVNTRILDFDSDASAGDPVIKKSTLDAVEQVVAQGARRRNMFTVSDTDNNLVAGWGSSLQTDYNAGASTAGDYPAASEVAERSRRNQDARAAERLESVYSRFALPKYWNLMAGDGVGGAQKPVSKDDFDGTTAEPIHRPELFILPELPIKDGHDYSGIKVALETVSVNLGAEGPFEELPPLVFVPLPEDPTRYVQIEKVGVPADIEDDGVTDRTWSASVRVSRKDPGALILSVTGAARHVLAKTDFIPLPSADDDGVHLFDWKDFIFTVAIEDERHCEARWPAKGSPDFDFVRRILIPAGESYKLDYIVPNTVMAIDPTDGSLVRSTSGGFVRDDRDKLLRLAKTAFQWYSKTRVALEFSTADIKSLLLELNVGDFVEEIGDQTVAGDHQQTINSVVTEIQITIPSADSLSGVASPRVRYVTQFAELDVLRL